MQTIGQINSEVPFRFRVVSKQCFSQIQPLHGFLKLINRYPHIPLGIRQAGMIQPVHDQRQAYIFHAGMPPPHFAQTMCSEDSS